ncbi:unnamed protein product, partial [Porites lobata]
DKTSIFALEEINLYDFKLVFTLILSGYTFSLDTAALLYGHVFNVSLSLKKKVRTARPDSIYHSNFILNPLLRALPEPFIRVYQEAEADTCREQGCFCHDYASIFRAF